MRDLLSRHPYAVPAALLAAVVLVAAVAVLPQLDGVEIRSVTVAADGDEVEVEVAYRLASAPVGTILVRVLTPAREHGAEQVAVGEGRAVARVRTTGAGTEPAVVVAELKPSGAGSGLLASLFAGRRRAAFALRSPDPPGSTPARAP